VWKLVKCAITILDIIHRPVFKLKHDVSETEICLRPPVEPIQFDPIHTATAEAETIPLLGPNE
jgi:hypothetical protein